MIKLSKTQIAFLLAIKGRTIKINARNWAGSLKPLFTDCYGWSAEDFPRDYHWALFNFLFDLYMEVRDSEGYKHSQIKDIFKAAFDKSISRDQELPIERAIAELCGLIQCVTVKNPNGTFRIDLELE